MEQDVGRFWTKKKQQWSRLDKSDLIDNDGR